MTRTTSDKNATTFRRGSAVIYNGDALKLYHTWEAPTVIISDGPYGLGMYEHDPPNVDGLVQFYEPHIMEWSRLSGNQTTLWFWNTELGWATTHPVLEKHGWRYVNCHIWNKGIKHIAGNVNTKTIRKFPVVTEVCVQYVRDAGICGMSIRDWLRHEWMRTGLPLNMSNKACGLANAATRKYLTADHLWYFPPPDMFERLAAYANLHGNPDGRPYFSLNGISPASAAEWSTMRAKFRCKVGVTNVWDIPPLRGPERLKSGSVNLHCNQKPLELIRMLLEASSDEQDMVWEPFGGLCTISLAANQLSRRCHSAEINRKFYDLAVSRLAYESTDI